MENIKYFGNRFEFQGAFLSAQKAFAPLLKDANNPHFKSKYAALINVLSVAREPLLDNGISLTQSTTIADGCLLLETEMAFVGEKEVSGVIYSHSFPLPANLTAQQLGSWITYMRRYVLMPIFGIAPEDDDGNKASETSIATQKPRVLAMRTNWKAEIEATKTISKLLEWIADNKTALDSDRHSDSMYDMAINHAKDLLSAFDDVETMTADYKFNKQQLAALGLDDMFAPLYGAQKATITAKAVVE